MHEKKLYLYIELKQNIKMKHFFLILLVTLIFVSCKDKREKTHPTIENISEAVYASGIIKSKNQYQVFATANGLIQTILVTEGDLVEKNQPIILLANEASRLNTENARIAAEYADMNANSDRLNELKINIEMAKSKMLNDSLLLVRQKNLWSNKIGSQVEFEQRELAYKNSLTAYETAIFHYNELKKQLNFSAQQSQKNLQISSSVNNDYIIKSKVNGKIYSILKEPGEMVTPQSPVAVIGDANEFIIELQVDEYDIAKIRLGQKVFITMDSYKGQVFEARVTKIYPIMNERSKSFTVETSFISRPQVLYPYLTAETNILIRTKEKALIIPRNYLIEDTFVLLENNEKRKVTVGLKDFQKVEILSGLSINDLIVKP
jgi:HlyD family secretion protein